MYPHLVPFRLRLGLKPILPLLIAFSLHAQIGYPGQYPPGRYPGQYPPGQYPPGQGPQGRGSSGNSGGNSKSQGRTQRNADRPVAQTYSGMIRKLDGNTMELELEDTRVLKVDFAGADPKPSEMKIGDGVDVSATENHEGPFRAESIKPNAAIGKVIAENDHLDEPEEQQQQLPPDQIGPPPTIMSRPGNVTDEADAPPKLKRGMPQRVSASQREDATTPSAPAMRGDATPPSHEIQPAPPPRVPAGNPRMAFVEKAREVAANYLDNLPNFVCQEVTTRYGSDTRPPNWQPLDVLTADVVYESGKESYRNLTSNGKPLKKSPEESGAWSTGEFGTILAEIFAPFTKAQFRFSQDDTVAHRPSSIYDFSVERLRSAWKVEVPDQYVMPPYKGSVWLDKESGHTLRIEMQAKEIPAEFPRVAVETAVDYDYISLGTPEKFLLPVRAEVLSCSRGSNDCDRNVIEFRNYHKFSGESIIKFDQQ